MMPQSGKLYRFRDKQIARHFENKTAKFYEYSENEIIILSIHNAFYNIISN
jgi:hypothetical protein